MRSIPKPKRRSDLRKKLGKEYYCLKRQYEWIRNYGSFASHRDLKALPCELKKHQSLLLRELKGVDMYLQHNKVVNLKLAIQHLDGILIRPGETFSFWKQVGRPTRRKGYLKGMTLTNGQVTEGIGGGLCQLGNLIYWMSLHSPLKIVQRWRHSYDVFPDVNRKLPFGSGATLSYNYIDLQVKNETPHTFQLKLWVKDEYLHGALRCDFDLNIKYEVFERNHHFEQQWWGGFTRHNEIWRKVISTVDQSENEELITQNHAIMMYNPLIEN